MPNIFFEINPIKNTGRLDRKNVIFVEGPDDANFLDVLLEKVGASPDDVGVVTVGGKGNFPSQLNLFAKSPPFTRGTTKKVCIIRDADDNPSAEGVSTKSIFLKTFGAETAHGKLSAHNGIEFGFFIMPNSFEPGDLEKLCLSTVEGNEVSQKVERFFESLTNPPVDKTFKRKAQVYLAAQNGNLARGAGQGFKDGYFNAASAKLDEIIKFLEIFVS